MNLVFATHNANKAREIAKLAGEKFSIVALDAIGCTEDIAETGSTLQANAEIKARYVTQHYNVDCFADDTGLLVDALDGAPGVYSARYAGEEKNDQDNMSLLLQNLEGRSNRKARFVTVICLLWQGNMHFFEGRLEGKIIEEKRGGNGFGYDPLFMPDGYNITLAEMSLEEKNRISHRAKAFGSLLAFLKKI